ncbi:MAG: hypothetical protein ACK5YF_02040 [Rhodobacterales bacterium]
MGCVAEPITPIIAVRQFRPSRLRHVFCADIVGRNAMAGLVLRLIPAMARTCPVWPA